MTVGLLINPHKHGALRTLRALCAALESQGCAWIMDDEAAALAGRSDGIPAAQFKDRADIAVVLGGDGTMLHAVSKLGDFRRPVAGINIGTLGFLTSCMDDELEEFARAIAEKHFTTSERTLLLATVQRANGVAEQFTALNEVTLARGETGRLVGLRASVDGQHLNDYRADGLLVATPTGSTAYSLSAGGPLISPTSRVFVITPICPHSLSQRSLVLADESIIDITPADRDDAPMIFTVDGRDTTRITSADTIRIQKSDRLFHFMQFENRCFYEALRQKLGWQGI